MKIISEDLTRESTGSHRIFLEFTLGNESVDLTFITDTTILGIFQEKIHNSGDRFNRKLHILPVQNNSAMIN